MGHTLKIKKTKKWDCIVILQQEGPAAMIAGRMLPLLLLLPTTTTLSNTLPEALIFTHLMGGGEKVEVVFLLVGFDWLRTGGGEGGGDRVSNGGQ